MSYDLVLNGIANLLNGLGYSQASASGDFENATTQEYENTFILTCEEGQADDVDEQQSNFLYDNQKWTVQIAFGKSSQSELIQRDQLNRKKDELLTTLDDSDNWRSFCTLLRYRAWSIEELDSYYVLKIELKVKDALTY